SGCAYAGCTSLAGANEVLQGRSLVCRCERVSYCSSTCQMLDWMGGHHQVCKMRPRKNESALPSRTVSSGGRVDRRRSCYERRSQFLWQEVPRHSTLNALT
ncbi:hypothetical protein Vretifemale_16776, partial [Volvox reticuliferus]